MTDGAEAFRVLVVFFDWFVPPCSDKKIAFLPVQGKHCKITTLNTK